MNKAKQLVSCLKDSEIAINRPSWGNRTSRDQENILRGRKEQLEELEMVDFDEYNHYINKNYSSMEMEQPDFCR
jgi:hypothetical protein